MSVTSVRLPDSFHIIRPAFTFRARTLLFLRLKLAYSVRAYRNANAVSITLRWRALPSIHHGCARRFLTIRPDRGSVSSSRDANSPTTLCNIRNNLRPLKFNELAGNHAFEISSFLFHARSLVVTNVQNVILVFIEILLNNF